MQSRLGSVEIAGLTCRRTCKAVQDTARLWSSNSGRIRPARLVPRIFFRRSKPENLGQAGLTIIFFVPIDPRSSVAPGTRHFESTINRGLACSRSTLLHQRSGALAELLKRHFQRTKFLRAQFREHFLHLPGVLFESRNDEVLPTRGKADDTHTSVFRALNPGYQALREEAGHGDTDRSWGQIDDRADPLHGQRPFVRPYFPP